VYLGGLFIAAFVSIPIVNLATPMFAMAFMVHLHKRLGKGLVRNQGPVIRDRASGNRDQESRITNRGSQ